MEQKVVEFWKGYVQIQIFGESCERFLNLCAFHNIRLWNLEVKQGTYTACLAKTDYLRIKSIVKKSHVSIRIIKKYGMPFFLYRYRKRRLYAAGILTAVCGMCWMSSHIWKISIEGNLTQTDDIMFEYLMQHGIKHGTSRAKLDCKMLADDIRSYFSDFSWTTVELKGTHLIISVKEEIEQKHACVDMENRALDLTAAEDGIITSVFVRKGTALVEAGSQVKKGDLLVAGLVPIVDDSKTVVSWQETQADADIVIQRIVEYSDQREYRQQEKCYTGKEKNTYAVRLGNTVFALPFAGTSFQRYELYSVFRQIQIGDHFYLPICIQKFTAKEYVNEEIIYTKEQCAEFLKMNFQYFMKNLEEKGVQIFENDVKIEWNEKSAIAEGTILIGESAVKQTAVTDRTKEELLKYEYD